MLGISPDERIALREEFLHVMQERFLAGQDQEFDYRWTIPAEPFLIWTLRYSLHRHCTITNNFILDKSVTRIKLPSQKSENGATF